MSATIPEPPGTQVPGSPASGSPAPGPAALGGRHRSRPAREEPTLLLVGTDHRSSPVELREKVSMKAEESAEALGRLLGREEISEAVILSTCNRTEVYLAPRDEEGAYRAAVETIFRPRAPEITEPGRLLVLRNSAAAQHLLAVASGLESMVLGEPEILGQVKQAATLAEAVGGSGTVLAHLLKTALTAGKRARAETAIGAGAVSLGYAAVELARNIFQNMEETRVLMVGAGEIARSSARALVEKGARSLVVANRTLARAESFREEFPGTEIVPFEDRYDALAPVELVVVSTGASEPVLTRSGLAAAMRRRQNRPLLVVDLSVPRNVDPAARKVGNLFLHDIDSLESLIERNLKRRREEVPRVQAILGDEMVRFYKWFRALSAEPLVAQLQRQAEAVRRQELEKARARFPEEMHEELDRLTRSLVRKILHHPSTRLRRQDGDDALPRLDLVRELFQLSEPEE